MTKTAELLTIIFVTLESAHRMEAALRNIPQGVRVIVVDNDSHDNTIETVRALRPSTDIITLDHNSGYGRANNRGLERVKTKYALLLNPDATISGDALDVGIDILEKNTNIGALGCGRKKYHTEELADIDAVGGVMFLPMAVVQKVGMFDEKLFLYSEDADICWRILKAGYRVCRSSLLEIDHKAEGSVNIDDVARLKLVLQGQSRAYLTFKQNGLLLGRVFTYWKAYRSMLYAFYKKHKHPARLAKREGMLDFLKHGEKILFDNELAKRKKSHHV
jgi:GT2 family glycosyltransferase